MAELNQSNWKGVSFAARNISVLLLDMQGRSSAFLFLCPKQGRAEKGLSVMEAGGSQEAG